MIIQKGTTTIIIPTWLEKEVRWHELCHIVHGGTSEYLKPSWWLQSNVIMVRSHIITEKVRHLLQALGKWYMIMDDLEKERH